MTKTWKYRKVWCEYMKRYALQVWRPLPKGKWIHLWYLGKEHNERDTK